MNTQEAVSHRIKQLCKQKGFTSNGIGDSDSLCRTAGDIKKHLEWREQKSGDYNY